MILKYKIHYIDAYGQGVIECDTFEEYHEALKNLKDDPQIEDFWCEWLDSEEGWQG